MTGEKRMAAAALVISVFVAGIVGGAATMSLLGRNPPDDRPVEGKPGGPPRMLPPWAPRGDSLRGPKEFSPGILGERMSRDLELTEDQRARILEVVAVRQERVSSLMQELAGPLRAQFDSMNAEIREMLTPSQQAVFDRILEREEAMFRGDRDPFPGGPLRPGGRFRP